MIVQNSIKLLSELAELESKIKEVETYLSQHKIYLDDETILKIIQRHLQS